jgi:pyruvate formate lyase activating enzyme
VAVCPEQAIVLSEEGVVTDTALCNLTGLCAAVCPSTAIEMTGKMMTIEEIMTEIEKERVFMDQSGGGVTISGGEPLLHPDFLIRILDECRESGIHTAVDTAGLANPGILMEVARRTDLFLFDLKMMDPERHKKWTGVSNEKILENLKALATTGVPIIIRIPLIGGVNDDTENLVETARFIAALSGEKKEVNILPYHKIAQTKYTKLGRPDDFQLLNEPDKDALDKAVAIFQAFGIKATIG